MLLARLPGCFARMGFDYSERPQAFIGNYSGQRPRPIAGNLPWLNRLQSQGALLARLQKCRRKEPARNPRSAATGGSLGFTAWEAFDGGRGPGTVLNQRAAQQQPLAICRAAFTPRRSTTSGAPPSLVWQTSLCFARSTTGGFSSSCTKVRVS